jgi:hypothetical protein
MRSALERDIVGPTRNIVGVLAQHRRGFGATSSGFSASSSVMVETRSITPWNAILAPGSGPT